jgi:hypothetical protein
LVGAASPSTGSAHKAVSAGTRWPNRAYPWTLDRLLDLRGLNSPSGENFSVRAQPFRDHGPQAEQPSEPSPQQPSTAGTTLDRSVPVTTSNHRIRGRARQRAKVRRASSPDADDLEGMADDDHAPDTIIDPSLRGSTARGDSTAHSLPRSTEVPPAGPPLSPTTARALAKGFRWGDLALASAAPLRVRALHVVLLPYTCREEFRGSAKCGPTRPGPVRWAMWVTVGFGSG